MFCPHCGAECIYRNNPDGSVTISCSECHTQTTAKLKSTSKKLSFQMSFYEEGLDIYENP